MTDQNKDASDVSKPEVADELVDAAPAKTAGMRQLPTPKTKRVAKTAAVREANAAAAVSRAADKRRATEQTRLANAMEKAQRKQRASEARAARAAMASASAAAASAQPEPIIVTDAAEAPIVSTDRRAGRVGFVATDRMGSLNAERWQIAVSAGRREQVLAALSEKWQTGGPDQAVALVPFGAPAVYALVDGTTLPANRNTPPWVTVDAGGVGECVPGLLEGSIPCAKVIDGFAFPSGVALIVAGGDAGKTPLAHALAAFGRKEYSIVRVGEPMSGYTSSFEEAARALASAMTTGNDIVLDSIKDLLSGSGSGAMKSGISRGALMALAQWSSVACSMGITIFVPVNPSVDDPEVISMLAEAARSNATSTILPESNGNWNVSARSGEGLLRRAARLSMTFDRDGVPSVKLSHDDSGPQAIGETFARWTAQYEAAKSRPIPSVSVDVWETAITRSLKKD